MATNMPTIRAGFLELEPSPDGERQVIPLESDAWFAWLESAHRFAFEDPSGRFTARKKRRWWTEYWYAFRRGKSRPPETYIGKARDITLDKLREVAGRLNQLAARTAGAWAEPSVGLPPWQAPGSSSRAADSPGAGAALSAPQVRLSQLVRTAALDRVAQTVKYPLTVISAPPGYGKTTLLTQMTATMRLPAAWLTLDERDNDPVRFWAHVSAALAQVDPGLSLVARQSKGTRGRPRPAEVSLAALVAALPKVSSPLLLILDDYHALKDVNSAIHEALAYLVEHLPPWVHLVVASRTIPPLPLAKLRARHRLLELGAADLQLTFQETRDLLNQLTRLDLSHEEIAVLHARTEGWVAALQLAALSLREQSDPRGWIAEFSGETRHIFDYLVEEVVKRLPHHLYAFVVQIALLNRLSGPLCDAVTRSGNSQAMLEEMERANLFVVPLDDRREWYRLHHLFADVLRRHLRQTRPRQVPQLYARASSWCETHALPLDAIDYAFAASEFEEARTAQLVEAYIPVALANGYVVLLRDRLDRLPDREVRERPHLCVAHAYALFLTGERTVLLRRVREAEEAIAHAQAAHTLDPAELAILRAETLALRSGVRSLLGEGNPRELIAAFQRAAAALPRTHELQTFIALYVGINQALDGDVRAARQTLDGLMRQIEAEGTTFYVGYTLLYLGLVTIFEGRLDDALAMCRRAAQRLAGYGDHDMEARIHLIRGKVAHERNDLEQALESFERGISLRYDPGAFLIEGFPTLAYTQLALGDAAAAQQTIARALAEWAASRAEHKALIVWTGRQLRAHQARLWLLRGEVGAAAGWAREREQPNGIRAESTSEPPSYTREWEEIVLARLYLAEHRAGDALALLETLGEAAEAGGRVDRLLEILVLKTLAYVALDYTAAALWELQRAVELGRPQRFVRPFVEGGPAIQRLLPLLEIERAGPSGAGRSRGGTRLRSYVASLLDAFAPVEQRVRQGPVTNAKPASHASHASHARRASQAHERTHAAEATAPALTPQQRHILRLIERGASNKDIAEVLVISPQTVNRHASNIFARLGVHSRTQAVARGRELGMLGPNEQDETETPADPDPDL